MAVIVVVLLLLLPAIGALAAMATAAAGAGPARGAAVARVGLAATGLSAIAAVVLLVQVAVSGPVTASWTGAGGWVVLGVAVDRLTGVLLLLVCGVSTLVQGFAARYLAGDQRQTWFVAGTGVVTAASAGLMSSVTLIGLAMCWSAAGLGLWLLLGTYPGLPAARGGQARTGWTFLIGDAALWAAVGIATARWGTLDLRHLDPRSLPGSAGLLPVLGCLVVVAALSRSAQIPLQAWLPATLATPTPVSALLHAGVINAGGVLLIRLAPLSGGSSWALGLAFAAGLATAVYGTALMLTKTDVKGSLAHSTMGQMGFMIMTCGLGLYASAVIHLVLHGVYKASLFLASGTAIHTHLAAAAAPPAPALSPLVRRAIAAGAVLAPGLLLGTAVRLLYPSLAGHAGAAALLLFAWATATATALGWLRRHPTARGVTAATVTLTVSLTGYVALIDAANRWLAPALPTPAVTLPATGWLLVAAVATLLATGLLGPSTLLRAGRMHAPARVGRLRRRLYVLALNAGHVGQPRPRPALRRRAHPAAPTPAAPRQPLGVSS